jgi:hypothetical protein
MPDGTKSRVLVQEGYISGNQTRCASPAATAHHLSPVPIRRLGVRRQIGVRRNSPEALNA